MNKNKKIIAIAGASLAAVGALTAGSFAFFTDSEVRNTTGTAGKVEISMTEIALSGSGNINPGDNDASVSAGARPGTSHDLTFSVTNDGNKSIMTRNIVTLSVKDGITVKDAKVYSLLKTDGTELNVKYVSVDGVEFVEASTVAPATEIKAVRYVTDQVALNGFGTDAETETGVTAVSQAFDYKLKLAKEADDSYELSTLTVDVEVQAMQYRNTADAEWETLYAETLNF